MVDEKQINKEFVKSKVGKLCKIVTKEPEETRASAIKGIIEDVDFEGGFVLVNSRQGLGVLRFDSIIEIRERRIWRYK